VRTEVVGERGVIAIGRRPPAPRAETEGAGWGAGPLRFDAAYAAEIHSFVRTISDGAAVPVGGAEALAALRIALAADRSMREGRPVAVEAA
jgi:myo-inositol 2-dehydrogenase/D-chiro-inositol 1-dehydrogenase